MLPSKLMPGMTRVIKENKKHKRNEKGLQTNPIHQTFVYEKQKLVNLDKLWMQIFK